MKALIAGIKFVFGMTAGAVALCFLIAREIIKSAWKMIKQGYCRLGKWQGRMIDKLSRVEKKLMGL